MADWAAISSMATAGGTLVLAVATFGAVRSANRAARTAERSLLAGLRPLLLAGRPQDPPEKVTWIDEHIAHVEGGRAVVDEVDGAIYLAALVRNVGAGIGVLHGWCVHAGPIEPHEAPPRPEDFRRLVRDLYIPAGDTGFWQGAIRDPDDPFRPIVEQGLQRRQRFGIHLLYGDYEGGQRTITHMGLMPVGEDGWLCAPARHWNVDRDDPR